VFVFSFYDAGDSSYELSNYQFAES